MIVVENFERVGLAYRKAKVDLYYSSDPCLEAIASYEDNLHQNLYNLLSWLNGEDEAWVTSLEFVGTWSLAPKSVDMSAWEDKSENGLLFSSPSEKWSHLCSSLSEMDLSRPIAEFRLMAKCSMSFHVLSALWMLEVGHLFDAKLEKCAYGNRLRRPKDGNNINELSLGSFAPYLKPFRDWRDHGIDAMQAALNADKKVVAITADVSSFFHELNPGFMIDPVFIQGVLGVDLSAPQAKLNRLFIAALQTWAEATPLRKGLPVGLPASALIANVALFELDRVIERQVVPLYYGRYVDDIILVMENGAHFNSTVELWEWLFERTENLLSWGDEAQKEIAFRPDYLERSQCKVRFANSKNKVFLLSGETGKTLIGTITQQIQERASEWRAMPRLPHSASDVGSDLLSATQSNGEAADSLRKTDSLTMRRAEFAIRLRDFEAYERDLHPNAWEEHRKAFFGAFIQHVLVLPQFFELAVYLPRVVRLATACEDFDDLRKIVDALERLCTTVEKSCDVSIKACPDFGELSRETVVTYWREQLFSSVRSSMCAAFPPSLSSSGERAWNEHISSHRISLSSDSLFTEPFPVEYYRKSHSRLFSYDLAHMPFRFIGLQDEVVSKRGIPHKSTITMCDEAVAFLPIEVVEGTAKLSEWLELGKSPHGLLFATRPYNLAELSLLEKDNYTKSGLIDLREVVLALRGFQTTENMPRLDRDGVLQVSDGETSIDCRIAVSSWNTSRVSWTAAVTKWHDKDSSRYVRLNRLIDSVISEPEECRYLIMPELALPAHWFVRIARKLQGRGISLITGIEYLHASGSQVRNQIWASLSHDGLGFPSFMIYRQDKQRPALHEEEKLHKIAGLTLVPKKTWATPPIIQHGELRFALLVCSELTNINYRSALPGKIDALFVPEWNQDTETFNALVESAALDIHAYIIQCNDRQYGDSRIRAPFKENWKRDVLRIKGGLTDYCVTGRVDVMALREFQSSHRSPDYPFKPVPDGFKICPNRKVMPKSG